MWNPFSSFIGCSNALGNNNETKLQTLEATSEETYIFVSLLMNEKMSVCKTGKSPWALQSHEQLLSDCSPKKHSLQHTYRILGIIWHRNCALLTDLQFSNIGCCSFWQCCGILGWIALTSVLLFGQNEQLKDVTGQRVWYIVHSNKSHVSSNTYVFTFLDNIRMFVLNSMGKILHLNVVVISCSWLQDRFEFFRLSYIC